MTAVATPRPDGRAADALRPLVLERGANPYAEGSCLIRMGGTLVHCTASVEQGVPGFRKGSGLGWVTAEYAMLPRATTERTQRERNGAGGRTQEIQRLIGRSLRAAMGTMAFGEWTIRVDCDVLQADGGTRCASITGACVALHDACAWLANRTGQPSPFGRLVAAVSVGVIAGEPRLDLAYLEDRDAIVDANVVMLEPDAYVEVQGTGEHGTFARAELDRLLDLAGGGLDALFRAQRATLGR
ncbi:MAG: ribonuclease PH [Gemmatimonadales bacterium]|nr:ribonuclease PH [Gemmatimonadales bacterium]